MLAALAFVIVQQAPIYKMKVHPLNPDNGRVEVAWISPNGNVAANQGGEDKYNADDNIRFSHPVLIIQGKVVYIKSALNLEVEGINDRGQAVLFERTTYQRFIYEKGKLTELKTDSNVDRASLKAAEQDSDKPITVAGLPTLETQCWFPGPFGIGPQNIAVGYGTHEREGDGPRVVDEYALYRNAKGIVPLITLVKHPPRDVTLQEGGRINDQETIAASGYVRDAPAIFLLTPIKR